MCSLSSQFECDFGKMCNIGATKHTQQNRAFNTDANSGLTYKCIKYKTACFLIDRMHCSVTVCSYDVYLVDIEYNKCYIRI